MTTNQPPDAVHLTLDRDQIGDILGVLRNGDAVILTGSLNGQPVDVCIDGAAKVVTPPR